MNDKTKLLKMMIGKTDHTDRDQFISPGKIKLENRREPCYNASVCAPGGENPPETHGIYVKYVKMETTLFVMKGEVTCFERKTM